MPAKSYQIRICLNATCGMRYPLTENHPFGERCPICLGATEAALTRSLNPEPVSPPSQPFIQLEALLDNVRSAWNVGAMFRTADGLGIRQFYLCGITPTPEKKEVQKTALGAQESIAWQYARDAVRLAEKLKSEGAVLWALEQDERSVALGEVALDGSFDATKPIILIVGNEVTGVDPGLLDLCERIVHIPMRGQKRSLNVEVAFGIAAHQLSTLTLS